MNPLRPLGLAVMLGLAFVALTPTVRANPVVSSVVAQDDGSFSLNCRGTSKFTRSTEKLKAAAIEAAKAYCAGLRKEMKIVSLEEHKGVYLVGDFPSVDLVFKAVDAVAAATSSEVSSGEVAAPSGDLYTILIRLDDLRKKGILTEDEFQAEKKKVLARSK